MDESTPREGQPLDKEQLIEQMRISAFSEARISGRILKQELDAANKEAIPELKPYLDQNG